MLLQAMSALPGKDWYLGGSKGFEGKKGPFGKTPEKLQQCFINTDGRTDVVQSFYAPEWLQSMEVCTFTAYVHTRESQCAARNDSSLCAVVSLVRHIRGSAQKTFGAIIADVLTMTRCTSKVQRDAQQMDQPLFPMVSIWPFVIQICCTIYPQRL